MGKFNLERFKNKHFWVLVQNAVVVLTGFGMSYLLFHYLSIEALGMWFFVQSIVALCESARYGFLATATVTFYAGAAPERAANVLGSIWTLALAFSGIILGLDACALFLLPYTHNTELIMCIKWLGITYLSSLPADVIFWRLQADEKYSTMFWYRMINSFSTIAAFTLLIIFHKMSLENALMWNFITNCTSSLFGILWNMAGIKYIFKRSKETTKELFHYGKYTLGTTTFSTLLGNVDTWIINFMLGPASVAIYNLACRFLAIVELPLRTFVTTGMSEMAIQYNKQNMHQFTYIFKKYVGMLTLIFIPMVIGALLLADLPINFLGGAQYKHSIAANSFRLFMVASLFYPYDRFNGLALDVTRHTKVNFYKMILMLIAKVLGNFAGLYIFGNVFGINFSSFFMLTAAVIFGHYQLRKYLDINMRDIFSLGYSELVLIIRKILKLRSPERETTL